MHAVAEVLVPHQVLCFCSVCVWKSPAGPCDVPTGYDIRFSDGGASEVVISKSRDELFHVASDAGILNLGPQEGVLLQVKHINHISTQLLDSLPDVWLSLVAKHIHTPISCLCTHIKLLLCL